MDKMDPPIRAFFLFIGAILWLGIWLSGFDRVHWVLYLPRHLFCFFGHYRNLPRHAVIHRVVQGRAESGLINAQREHDGYRFAQRHPVVVE